MIANLEVIFIITKSLQNQCHKITKILHLNKNQKKGMFKYLHIQFALVNQWKSSNDVFSREIYVQR